MKTTLFFLFLISPSILMAQVYFSGFILEEETKEGIPGAKIYLPDLAYGAKSEVDGSFKLSNLPEKEMQVQISATGFETVVMNVDFSSVTVLDFSLKHAHIELDEVLISNPTSRLQSENILGIDAVKIDQLKNNGATSLAEGLANIKGVDVSSTGVGIGKPVIRGLSGNRIVTYADGVRIENQQWGGDHGLGIGDLGIGGVEIIKGPASLLYGSDAMGGVLYFVPENYAEANSIEAFVESSFNSATLGSGNEYGVKLNKRIKLNLGGSYNTHANYLLPSSAYVRNTAFDEANFKASLGFNTKNWVTNVRYSYMINHFGITEDSLVDTLINRDIAEPFQRIENHRFSAENIFYLKNSRIKFRLGISSNIRKEFEAEDSTHEHEYDEDSALHMILNTTTYDLKWHKPFKNKKSTVITGIQGMYQGNENRGEELLIPDATMIDAGYLFILKHNFTKDFTIQFGERVDLRAISAAAIDDTALNYVGDFVDKVYGGLTTSAGLVYHRKLSKIRFNLATGFRAPNISELTSFGVHHGTLRFEIGSQTLRKEQNLQLDLEFERDGEHLKFAINPFFNTVKDYIYLDPDTMSIDGFKVYRYEQDDVFLFGGEAGIHFHPHGLHWLHLESNYSYVQAKYYDGGHPPLTPAPRINSTIRIEFESEGNFKFENIYVNHIFKSAQTQTAVNEISSPAYNLLNLGLKMRLNSRMADVVLNAGVRNILNTTFIDHLSRFKDFGLPAMGRNFFFSLRIELNGDLNKDYNKPPTRQEQIKEKVNKKDDKSDKNSSKKKKKEKSKG